MPLFFLPLLPSTQHPHPEAIASPLFMSTGHCIRSSAALFPILSFTSPWLFCNHLFVLVNPLTSLFMHFSTAPPFRQPSKPSKPYVSISESVLVCLVCFLDPFSIQEKNLHMLSISSLQQQVPAARKTIIISLL